MPSYASPVNPIRCIAVAMLITMPGGSDDTRRGADARRTLGRILGNGDPPARTLFGRCVLRFPRCPAGVCRRRGSTQVVALRKKGHPGPGKVPRWRCDPTPAGFVIEFEERWKDGGHDWYAREMARADVVDGAVTSLSVYCTGRLGRKSPHPARRRSHVAAGARRPRRTCA